MSTDPRAVRYTAEQSKTARLRAAALYEQGHTIACTAVQVGRSWSGTRTLLVRAGTVFRRQGSASCCTN